MDLKPFQSRLDALAKLNLNLDLERREEYTAANGWHLDHYEADLPGEPGGEPLKAGSFAAAKAVLRDYRFPPPDLITGIFVPDMPLEQRVMLLRARFLLFTFYFGVKISGVVDEQRQEDGEPSRVWGYRYATLEGHFERGQIEFLIVKNLQSGTVKFKISAFSKTGTIQNIFYRIGFALFGRRLQVRFARQSLARMQRLVFEALHTGRTPHDGPPVQTATAADPEARDKLTALGAPPAAGSSPASSAVSGNPSSPHAPGNPSGTPPSPAKPPETRTP